MSETVSQVHAFTAKDIFVECTWGFGPEVHLALYREGQYAESIDIREKEAFELADKIKKAAQAARNSTNYFFLESLLLPPPPLEEGELPF